MKKYLFLFCLILVCSTSVFGGANNVVRLNGEFPRILSVEYERKLNQIFPNLSAFINYGGAPVTIEEEKTELYGLNAGLRYKLPFIGYIGVGYGSLDMDYSYVATATQGSISKDAKVNVDGTLSGLLLEYGKELGIGPVLMGGKVYYLMGSPDITATVEDVAVEDSDVDQGLATIDGMPGVAVYVGIRF